MELPGRLCACLITPVANLTAVSLRNQICEINYTASYFYLPIACTLVSTGDLGLVCFLLFLSSSSLFFPDFSGSYFII